MKQLQDSLVWLFMIAVVFGVIRLSRVDWKLSKDDLMQPGQVERGAMLDRQMEEIRARNPKKFEYHGS
jgi:hypothetical protein